MATQREPQEAWFVIGDLSLRTLNRSFGGDGGPSLELYVKKGGISWHRVVRYDCFQTFPHRHLFYADGRESRARWGSGGTLEAIEATERELRTGLPAVLRAVGYGRVADELKMHESEIDPIVDQVAEDLRQRAQDNPP